MVTTNAGEGNAAKPENEDEDVNEIEDTEPTDQEARDGMPTASDSGVDADAPTPEPSVEAEPKAKLSEFKITTPDGKTHTLGDLGGQAKEFGGQVKDALKQPGREALGNVEKTGVDVVGKYAAMFIDGAKNMAAGWLGDRGKDR